MQSCVIHYHWCNKWMKLSHQTLPKRVAGCYLLICYGVCRPVSRKSILDELIISLLFLDKLSGWQTSEVFTRDLWAIAETLFRTEDGLSMANVFVLTDNLKFSYKLKLWGFNSVDTRTRVDVQRIIIINYHCHWTQPCSWNFFKFLLCFNYLQDDQVDGFLLN